MGVLLIDEVPEDVMERLHEEAEASHRDVADIAAEYLASPVRHAPPVAKRKEADLLNEIHKSRDEMARRGIRMTEDFLREAKQWGRLE